MRCSSTSRSTGLPTDSESLEALVARVPEGWTAVSYAGRRWGLTRTTHVDGRSVSVFAEELGGPDVVSANVFRLSGGAELRERGAVIADKPVDRGFGLCVMVEVPGADPVLLYEPKHRVAYGL